MNWFQIIAVGIVFWYHMIKANEEDYEEPLYGRIILAALATVTKCLCFDLCFWVLFGDGLLLLTEIHETLGIAEEDAIGLLSPRFWARLLGLQ